MWRYPEVKGIDFSKMQSLSVESFMEGGCQNPLVMSLNTSLWYTNRFRKD